MRSVSTDVRNARGEYLNPEVVGNCNLVTSCTLPDIPTYCKETLRVLESRGRPDPPIFLPAFPVDSLK